jgi:hypothetical protein
MGEIIRVAPNGPGDKRIWEGLEREREMNEKLDPRIQAIKNRQRQILKDSEVREADLELEFII